MHRMCAQVEKRFSKNTMYFRKQKVAACIPNHHKSYKNFNNATFQNEKAICIDMYTNNMGGGKTHTFS